MGGVTRGVDILPTLIDLCDLQAPDGWTCDGLSLASHLRRPDQSVAARISIVQYGHANEDVEFGFTGREQAAVMWRQWRLVQGRELYNVQDDPGQQRDVAAANPELVKRMRDDYAAWWDGVSATLTSYQPLTIGADAENPARLCSCDWAWVYADNQRGMRGCVMASGAWHVDAARPGLYNFSLRRWPQESGLGISDPAPVMQGVDGSWPAGKALPVASAWLQVGRSEQTLPVPPDATAQSFQMAVERGPATIKSWWHDEQGNQLAGAYYLTIERLRD